MSLVSDLHLVHIYIHTEYINISYCGSNENAPHKSRCLRTWSQLVALFGNLGGLVSLEKNAIGDGSEAMSHSRSILSASCHGLRRQPSVSSCSHDALALASWTLVDWNYKPK